MPLIDLVIFTQVLVTCLTDILDSGGWEQPDYLFALRGAIDAPELEYLMQIPGRAVDFLPSLSELGLHTGLGVHGLVVVSTDQESIGYGEALALPLMVKLRAVCAEAGLPAETVSAHQEATRRVLSDLPTQRGVCSVMGVLPDRTARVVTVRQGGGPIVQDDLPAIHGDHHRVMALLLRLMRCPTLPAPYIPKPAVPV